jgi:sarcosine oxidase subunit gamma
VVELVAKSPCAGLLPLNIGEVVASEVAPGAMTALAPYAGRAEALSQALEAAHGMALPAPGHSTLGAEGARVLWFGREMALMMGPAPDAGLAAHAAVSDQSDAWAVVRLDGPGAADVLARLTPLDLRAGVFETGQTARTELAHMAASVTRVGGESFVLMVFRAFAETLVHDLKIAMQGVAARREG